ncbi:amidase [Peristeroidobacter agariperforans]|uniref:amidase n=1 Tax=Peristeroidobacter agariperforans TaxID=268404 RepID=UPI00101C1C46|nr:amidase [Peristeroidobacter agariperforans]
MPHHSDLHYLDISELAVLIGSRELSSREITLMQLERIASVDRTLNSYASTMRERALEDAERADREIASGGLRGPLHGVPIAIKDICWTKNHPTSSGMQVHKQFLPDQDATVVSRLRAAGAVILGKTQLTEGAYSDYHPSIEPPKNPWNSDYWPGISSSGAAAATAAGLCFGGVASDTGGSIRWPCAANGTTGIKPTWGRVSRHGVFELAASLDHIGTIARSAIDAALLLQAIAGVDPLDPTTATVAVPNYLSSANDGLCGIRIGIDTTWNSADVDAEVAQMMTAALDAFRALGAEIVDIRVPNSERIIHDWVTNCAIEAATAHTETFAQRRNDYGSVLASVIEHGQTTTAIEYQRILLRRMEFRGRVDALFSHIDLLLTPVQPLPPLTLAAIQTLGTQPQLIAKLQRYTCPFNMSGHPSITLPAGASEAGMPMALQLIGAGFREEMLVRAGAAFQSTTRWHRRHPCA